MMDTALQNLLSDGTVTMPLEKFQMILERWNTVDNSLATVKAHHSADVKELRIQLVQLGVRIAAKLDMMGFKVPSLTTTSTAAPLTVAEAYCTMMKAAGWTFEVRGTRDEPIVISVKYEAP